MIKFNKHYVTGNEEAYIREAMLSSHLCGDGPFTKKCSQRLTSLHNVPGALLTPSCTHALELAALLIDIKPGDEVIMPSFTFVSTANAFALRGAHIVFVDVDPRTMNIDESLIEEAITPNTKAIVPVHYAGFMCDMPLIMDIAKKHGLYVIEDAAQAIGSSIGGKSAGSFGHYSALSFHETKNCTSGGEGGALLIRDESNIQRAEILREKGTNRSLFLRGEVDKYSWVDVGSSYLLSDIQSAYLYAQLDALDVITIKRKALWDRYTHNLKGLQESGEISLLQVQPNSIGNGHIFCFFTDCNNRRDKLLIHLKKRGIQATFHYVPLHDSIGAHGRARFYGKDNHTSSLSLRLIRLPMYYELSEKEVDYVTNEIYNFYLSYN